MGRTKQSRPIKRRRVILEADESVVAEEQTSLPEQNQVAGGETELARAIDLLRKTPLDQVEAAAAEATRLDLTRNNRWIHLRPPKFLLSPSSSTTLAIAFNENENSQVDQESFNHNGESLYKDNLRENCPISNDKATIHTTGDVVATKSCEKSSSEFVSRVPSWARGLGFARLANDDFEALQQLHQVIKDRINRRQRQVDDDPLSSDVEWASWSGSIEDPRKRAFGFLPGTWGYDPQIRNNRLEITMPQSIADGVTQSEERIRNKKAMLVLEKSEVPKGAEAAIRNLCRQFRDSLLTKEKNPLAMKDSGRSDHEYRTHLAEFLRYDYMIAAQPNLHSGRALLPVHLDDPKKDGFGVIIITIGMEGAGTILLRDAKGIHRGVAMRLETGDVYMLSDRARDSCSHGVLADGYKSTGNGDQETIPFSKRESLNLRFGLHDLSPPSFEENTKPVGAVPSSMVFQHWEG